jgi:hypothetical protein
MTAAFVKADAPFVGGASAPTLFAGQPVGAEAPPTRAGEPATCA